MFYQQGDVLFIPVDSIPEGTPKPDKIVALGEATGHMHRMIEGDVCVAKDGTIFVQAETEATVVHDDHGAITLPTGKYRVGIVREYDPLEEAVRDVRD